MHTSQQSPFVARLTPAQRQVLDEIRQRNMARFGDDAFRMEGEGGGEGGSGGEGGNGGEGGSGGSGEGGAGGGAGEGGSGGAGGAAENLDKVELDKLPKEVQDIVKRYRKEAAEANGKAREEARKKAAEEATSEVTKKIAEALGITKGEADKLTPEELQKRLEESGAETAKAQAAAREKDIELAVYRTASKAGGDPDALLDSRSFLAEVAKLDPSKNDFNEKVTAAIKDAVKQNSKLALRAGAGSSSVDHGAGGSGEGGERKVKPLGEAVAGHYGV